MKDDSDSEKQQQIHHIKNLYAFNLFCQKRFDESMQVFAKLGTGNYRCGFGIGAYKASRPGRSGILNFWEWGKLILGPTMILWWL